MDTTALIISAMGFVFITVLSILGFFLKEAYSNFNKTLDALNLKIDNFANKLEKMARTSDIQALEIYIEKEIEKREESITILETRIRAIEDKMNRCQNCNSIK